MTESGISGCDVSSPDGFRHRQVKGAGGELHVTEAGNPGGRTVVFLHGWPESWRTWQHVMTLAAADDVRAIAIDLPGIGESTGSATGGSKRQMAAAVHDLLSSEGITGVTLVGHDIGGMVVYAYVRAYEDVERAVIMDVPVPGVAPWDDFVRSPFLWHFALHAVPDLPEALVQGRQAHYFEYFYDALSADPTKITRTARRSYATAYRADRALSAGFDWYRAFPQDVEDNQGASERGDVDTPLLYLRGDRERGGLIDTYTAGFRAAGMTHVEEGLVPGSGHFTQEENPERTWQLIAEFTASSVAP